jgi:hypothetical protein
MRKIVRVCAGHVSIRTSSVCKELEHANAIESDVVTVKVNVGSCAGLVNTRINSVWKELGHVGATTKPADEGQGIGPLEGGRPTR